MRHTLDKIFWSVTLCSLAVLGAASLGGCDRNEGFDGEAEEAWQAIKEGRSAEEIGEEIDEATRNLTSPRSDLSKRIDELEQMLTERRQADGDGEVLQQLQQDLEAARSELKEGGEAVGEEVEKALLDIEQAIASLDGES